MVKDKQFNIYEFLKKRPLSWSAMSSFEYDPEQWYQNYYLGNKTPPTPEMMFGSIFAKSCEARKPLAPVTLLSKMEQPFKVMFGKIPLVGYADTFDHKFKKKIGEYKTGVKPWDQKRANNHGQIKMYALMNFITSKIKPEHCKFFLEWVPTKQMGNYTIDFVRPIKVHHFDIKVTMADIIKFGQYINSTVENMQRFVDNHD